MAVHLSSFGREAPLQKEGDGTHKVPIPLLHPGSLLILPTLQQPLEVPPLKGLGLRRIAPACNPADITAGHMRLTLHGQCDQDHHITIVIACAVTLQILHQAKRD